MKKIGFIDYYLDEWHANNYPKWLREASGDTMEVAYAWAKIDAPHGRTTDEWCRDFSITRARSVEQIIKACDYLIVLSPDNPEMHEELCDLPLRSGKRVYVDKTFAPGPQAAKRLIDLAAAHNTPMFSTSALRFSNELAAFDADGSTYVSSVGPGTLDNYIIHQAEPIVALLGSDPSRLMFIGTQEAPAWAVEFASGKRAAFSMLGDNAPFALYIRNQDGVKAIADSTGYFANFIGAVVDFFRTGEIKVPAEQTLAVMTICAGAVAAKKLPGVWLELNR
jgi:hypothetical protein